jgi:ParB/RepB/Spo0J family partition protein
MMNEKDIQPTLGWVSPKEIQPSEENPRRDDFYKDKDFLRLKESIAKYGVIVPIILKKLSKESNKKKYQLIDGERRWQASIDTNRVTIPAYIWPPERDIDVLVTMFQIHMNQEGWEAIEQARALEKLISALRTKAKQKHKREQEIEKELVRQLTEITGMDEDNAWSRIRFLRWPQKLREKIYNEPNKKYYSYAVEIEARIVEPALRNFRNIRDTISPDDIRQALFAKVTSGYVPRANEIRDAGVLTKRRRDKKEATRARSLLLQFIKDKSFTFPEAREQYFYLFPEETQKPAFSPRKLINTVRGLGKALNEYTEATLNTLEASQKKDLKTALNELLSITQAVLKRLK